MIFILISLQPESCLPSEESCAFVRSLFTFVLHLCDAGAKLHGSLWEDGWLAEAQLPRRQSQEEFLPDTSRKWQICLPPHGQRIQVAHHVLVQVGKSAGARVIFVRYSNLEGGGQLTFIHGAHGFNIFFRRHSEHPKEHCVTTLSTDRPEIKSSLVQ